MRSWCGTPHCRSSHHEPGSGQDYGCPHHASFGAGVNRGLHSFLPRYLCRNPGECHPYRRAGSLGGCVGRSGRCAPTFSSPGLLSPPGGVHSSSSSGSDGDARPRFSPTRSSRRGIPRGIWPFTPECERRPGADGGASPARTYTSPHRAAGGREAFECPARIDGDHDPDRRAARHQDPRVTPDMHPTRRAR